MQKLFVAIITLSLTFFITTNVSANEIYTVKAGDSLWTIARNNGVTVDYLKRVNNLNSDFLRIGERLIIKEVQTIPTNQVETILPVDQTEKDIENIIYIVKSGDSLWSIAQKTNVSIQTIKQLNNLNSDFLRIGDKLVISHSNTNQNIVESTPSRSGTNVNANRILEAAALHLGTPYRYGGSSPGGFDCSGYVSYIFAQFGYNLPRTASTQFQHGLAVSRADLQPGDLVFFKASSVIDHVGIYVGDNKFIHSSSPRSGGVIYSSLSESYYANSYFGAKRILR